VAEKTRQMQRQRKGERRAARRDEAERGAERLQCRGEPTLPETRRTALGGDKQPAPHQQFPAQQRETRHQRRAQRRRPPAGPVPEPGEKHKAEQREEDLREEAEAEIDRDRGRAACRRGDMLLQQPGAHDIAADLRRRQRRVDRLADPAQRQHRRESGPFGARQNAIPGRAIDDDRRAARREDRGKAPADSWKHAEQRRRIGMHDEPDDNRDAEREAKES